MNKKKVSAIISGAGWIGSFAGALVDDLEKLGVSFENIHKLNGSTRKGKILVRTCAEKIAELVKGTKETKNDFLSLISSNEKLFLDAVDGSETLVNAKDVFLYIDSDLKNWDTDKKGPVTQKTPVQVYEMAKNANFAQMFGSLSSDLHKLLLTQAQIKNFARKHRNWLRNWFRTDGYATFFLFKENKQFFVADVCCVVSDSSLRLDVHLLEDSYVWHAERCNCVVVPQLA